MTQREKILTLVIIAFVVLFVSWLASSLFIGEAEGTWVCLDGQWVKEGNPRDPAPTEPCGEEPIACTMDAKLCSDGSYVGRVAPDCQFAPCSKEDLIRVESPRANEKVSSPILIKGEARGTWFFEASFPLKLYDEMGNLVVQSFATAKGEWMTEDFVPYEGSLEFDVDREQQGTLVLEKDNPSGLPEHSDELRMPVILSPAQ